MAASETTAATAVPLPRPLQDLVTTALARWRATPEPWRAADGEAASLADAIGSGSLHVAYQPILALATRRPVAVEALIRLDDPGHPALDGAQSIIRVAEYSGLIAALGTQVLVRACAQLAAWRRDEQLRDLQIHVNVSPHQLRDDRFVEVVERTLEVTGLASSALVLEVTETAAFEGDGLAEATLTSLTNLGIEISIDDFGTGFASLELLASTPARSIKLDRSFVASVGELSDAPRGRALMVQAAIGLGHALGLRVVAEGIESERQARTLTAWGCTYGQGYHFARPARPEQLVLMPPPVATSDANTSPGRLDGLSEEVTELALATASVLAATAPDTAELRSDAMALAVLLAEASELDRREADTAAVLASLTDRPTRLVELLHPRSGSTPATELAHALAARPSVVPGACLGALASAARDLARAHADGRTLDDALAVLEATVAAGLRQRLEAWWRDERPSPSVTAELRGLERRLRHRDEAGRRLRSLTALTEAIGRSGSLEDVLEVTAEEARTALGAASVSISRLERDQACLRTLVNVGELAPQEQRRPTDEVYDLSDFPVAAARLMDRAIHIELADGGSIHKSERRLLHSLEKGSSAAIPIVIGGATWGEVYATTAMGDPPFTMADAPFVSAIANVVGLAIQGTEQVEQLSRLAGEDPLTRLANRRLLEQRLTMLLAEAPARTEVGLLMLDVDGLKDVNDEFGHAEGDAMLVRVGDVLSRTALTHPGALAARLAGDEFCLVVPGDGTGIETLVQHIRARLGDGPPPQPRLSAGFAVVRAGEADPSELLRRADAAQYRAKRTGAPLITFGPDVPTPGTSDPDPGVAVPRRRRASQTGDRGGATMAAVTRWRSMLGTRSASQRLETIGDAAVTLLDLSRWLLSEVPPGSPTMHIRAINVRRRSPGVTPFPPLDEQVYVVADFPATAAALRTGRGFHVHVDDPSADPAERALLAELGNKYVILLTETESDGTGWTIELFGDAESQPLDDAVALVEALASRTLGREVRCTSTSTP
ncbi:EAL domain-containing protein [Nitriliruptor alkaliphilus]|uniref:EAL domain-containing protein n=1 Tax=Nitriliruptor alkaliphilus TaxID=427918 RepID=UPI00069917DF|nr:EAL domain-containing protein [Nitriliruptor alkaliphilus]